METRHKSELEDTREDFCGACLAIPAALVGVGAAGVGAKKGTHDTMKKILLYGGVAFTLVSAAVAIYFITRCKNCK